MLDVKIGFSRESNWIAHTESAAHRQNEASKGTSGKFKLTSFFQKKLPGSSSWSSGSPLAASHPLLCNPTHSLSGSVMMSVKGVQVLQCGSVADENR